VNHKDIIVSWLLVIIASVNTTIGNLLLKKSRVNPDDYSFIGLTTSPWFIAGVTFYGINVIFFAKALEKLPLSIAYPVLAGLGFVFITLTAKYVFNESLIYWQYLGISFILIGIMFLSQQ